MCENFFVAANGILGIQSNVKKFRWAFGSGMPLADQSSFEACQVRIHLEVGSIPELSAEEFMTEDGTYGKYQYFRAKANEDELYYQRPFLFGAQLQVKVKGLLSNEPYICINETYYRFIIEKFINIHSLSYILTDLASILLLGKGYAPLYCAAIKNGEFTAVFCAPSNTGKTLTAVTLCAEKGMAFITEDLAITDGKVIHAVPWTKTFRYYPDPNAIFYSKAMNTLTQALPPLKLILDRRAETDGQHFGVERKVSSSEITHLVILEHGLPAVRKESKEEFYRRIVNLNSWEFNYPTSPFLVAYEFFNPALNIDSSRRIEQNILRRIVDNANERFIVSALNATHYADMVADILKSHV